VPGGVNDHVDAAGDKRRDLGRSLPRVLGSRNAVRRADVGCDIEPAGETVDRDHPRCTEQRRLGGVDNTDGADPDHRDRVA